MKLADVQPAIAAQLAARAELAAFGSIIQYNPARDEDDSAKEILDRVQSVGVVIEVIEPIISGASTDSTGVSTPIAEYVVAISESPVVAHSPSGMALVQAVIDAGTSYLAGRIRPSLSGKTEAIRENGYVVRFLSFTLRVDGRASA